MDARKPLQTYRKMYGQEQRSVNESEEADIQNRNICFQQDGTPPPFESHEITDPRKGQPGLQNSIH